MVIQVLCSPVSQHQMFAKLDFLPVNRLKQLTSVRIIEFMINWPFVSLLYLVLPGTFRTYNALQRNKEERWGSKMSLLLLMM